MTRIRLNFFLAIVFCSVPSWAVEQVNGQYVWQFLSGQSWPQGYNQNIGKPDNLMWKRGDYPESFFERINNALPETHVNEAFITNDDGATIHLSEAAEVFVTFLHEGAGYKNAFGFFTFDRNNPPKSIEQVRETIVFPNLSFPHLANGHRVSLGYFPAGTSLGFFIAANGFSYYTGVKQWSVPYYYTLQDLNPELDPSLRQHAVLLYDDEVSEVILGFEDLPRTWGDNDFNDAVFSVRASPETAIEKANLVGVPESNDSDADGIPDDDDEFPFDYRRTDSAYFPSENGFATLAFEDNWPNVGDFDFNDLVIQHQTRIIYDANGQVTGMIIKGNIVARGGAKANGFALRLADIPASEIEHAKFSINDQYYEKQADDYQDDAVIRLWRNSIDYTSTGETGKCSLFNTNQSCSQFPVVPFELDIRFSNSMAQLTMSQFDFFIFRTSDYSHEIHLPDRAPTNWFNQARFQKGADTSDPAANRYFRTENNLAWALHITEEWQHPREYIDILWAYPGYQLWAESGGVDNTDWITKEKRLTHVFNQQSGEEE